MSPKRSFIAIVSVALLAGLLPAVQARASAYVTQWGTPGSGNGEFDGPVGITTDPAGSVFVLDRNHHRIQKFTVTGTYLAQWGSLGSGNGQINSAWQMATDAAGDLYVADMFNHRIEKFSGTGAYLAQWGTVGTGDGQFLYPQGVAIDAAGDVYVADGANSRIEKFTSTGTFLTKWGTLGSGDGQFNLPTGVATDAAGNVYVADLLNHRIQKFTSAGVFLAKWGSLGSGNGQFDRPSGIAIDAAGNVYVADEDNHRVQQFTSAGTYLAKWGSFGPGIGQFQFPQGVATDAAGNVYVSDTNNNRVQKFAPADAVAADGAGLCLSTATPCVTVPIKWDRSNATPIRGYSVTLQLSANLSLCGAEIVSGGYLVSGSGGTSLMVTPLGGNQYIVDEVTLGGPCGTTGSGTLFTVSVTSSDPGGTGTISVLSVTARDCANHAVPASLGPDGSITIDQVAPTAVSNLGTTQVRLGNDADGTTLITVNFSAPGDAAVTEVYRKGFGGYPQYDENGGAVPTAPVAYPPAGWTLTPVTATGQTDAPPTRDYWYYVVYTKDGCGNVSLVSNVSGGTLDYHLGDTHDGIVNCTRRQRGEHAGRQLHRRQLRHHDSDQRRARVSRRRPDERRDGARSAHDRQPRQLRGPDPDRDQLRHGERPADEGGAGGGGRRSSLRLRVPALPRAGETFAVALELTGAGDVQGLSAQLDYDASVVEFLGVESGPLLDAQAAQGVVLSSAPGDVDVALLGTGAGLRGTGELARARFRVKARR